MPELIKEEENTNIFLPPPEEELTSAPKKSKKKKKSKKEKEKKKKKKKHKATTAAASSAADELTQQQQQKQQPQNHEVIKADNNSNNKKTTNDDVDDLKKPSSVAAPQTGTAEDDGGGCCRQQQEENNDNDNNEKLRIHRRSVVSTAGGGSRRSSFAEKESVASSTTNTIAAAAAAAASGDGIADAKLRIHRNSNRAKKKILIPEKDDGGWDDNNNKSTYVAEACAKSAVAGAGSRDNEGRGSLEDEKRRIHLRSLVNHQQQEQQQGDDDDDDDDVVVVVPGAVRVQGIDAHDDSQTEESLIGDNTVFAGTSTATAGSAAAGGGNNNNNNNNILDPSNILNNASASNLPKAEAIDEDEEGIGSDGMPITLAVKMDPNAKRRNLIFKNVRFRLYAFLAFAIIIAIVIGVGVGSTYSKKKYNPEEEQTAAPTTYRESIGIRSQVEKEVGEEVLRDPDSPYAKALDWITVDDPMELLANSTNLIQRFLTAYLYFATTVDGPWTSCNPPKDPWSGETICTWYKLVSTRERLEFMDVYPSTAWLSNSSECAWAGLTCDNLGQIQVAELAGFNLSGTFPEGIFQLPRIQDIVMSLGSLKGSLPSQLGKMDSLINLSLVHNQFSGSIPKEWWTARQIQNINIGHNRITGSLPAELGNLQDLRYLRFEHNRFSGPLPSEIGLLDNLSVLALSSNNINGTIPSTIGDMNRLQVLKLQANNLSGQIPTSIGELDKLQEFHLNSNPLLRGQLPDAIFINTDKLMEFDVSDCAFSGTISPLIGYYWRDLETLKVSNNKLHGTIPSQLSLLEKLRVLWLHGNDFTGTVPESVCSIKPKWRGKELMADCTPGNDGATELICSCCSDCCNPRGTDCFPTGSGNRRL